MNYVNFLHYSRTLCLFMVCSINILQAAQLTPADHLVPPPLPAHYQALKHAQQLPQNNESGFMTRIARWFGFGQHDTPQQQQLIPATNYDYNQQAETQKTYNYAPPETHFNQEKPCNPCNKYPWVPMFHAVVPHVAKQQNQWAQINPNLEAQASQNYVLRRPNPANVSFQQIPAKQRAVQWNFPLPYNNLYWNSFKNNAQQPAPPLPKSQNTNWIQSPPKQAPSIFESTTPAYFEQELPATEYTQFEESVGAQSNLAPNQVFPTQIPATISTEPTFEIIKSHQVTDYVSSVEYPATYVQAGAIDLLVEQKITTTEPPINTVKYKHETFAPNLDTHIPGSQILTDPSSFGDVANFSTIEETTLQSRFFDDIATTTYAPLSFDEQSLVVSNFHQQPAYYKNHDGTVADNFVSASSHNFTHYNNKVEQWTPVLSNFYETTTMEVTTSSMETTTYSLDKSNEWYRIIEKQERARETPKRLLDAPIQYQKKSGEKVSTRDPTFLNYRLGAVASKKPQEFHYSNHAYPETENTTTIFVTPQITTTTERLSSTSAYGAIDASGQFAGISPPAVAVPGRIVQTVVVPYTTKNQPRPFEPKNLDSASSSTTRQHWLQPEESRLIKSATAIPPDNRQTTKYLTKILATNLRELLHREKETKKKTQGIDITKLQKNIDEWTQLEYTALGHKASTPTIRGRSKHIPVEYLTTTTMAPPRQPKTTKLFKGVDLSTSINNLEPILEKEVGKRFDYVPIDDNRLLDLEEPAIINQSFATTTTAKPTPTQMSVKFVPTPGYPTVIASAAPKKHLNESETKELWQKARVSISPQTNEKVYVVTPVPRLFPQRRYLTTPDPPTKPTNFKDVSEYKSRFTERRSTGDTIVSSSAKEYNAQLFGLMGLSAFVPARPVEIIDGNSKVVTTITAAPRERGKPTMEPSPR